MSKNDFQERLKRLEAKNGGGPAPQQPDNPIRTTQRKPLEPTNVIRVLMVLGAIGFALFTGAGGLDGEFSVARLKESLKGAASDLVSDFRPKKKESAEDAPRHMTHQGWAFTTPGVASIGLPELVLADISTGHEAGLRNEAPAKLTQFAPNGECTLRRPRAGEVVHNVRLEHGNLETGLHSFTHAEMGEALIGHIEAVQKGSKRHYLYGKMASGRMASVDVFVTDRSAPVYLVLQGYRADTIWNLHLAPGVVLAHVAMVGEDSALSAPPKGTSFEAIRISDWITDFDFESNDKFRPCMVAPWLPPQDYWPSTIDGKNGNTLQGNYTYWLTKGSEAYAGWYRDVMGVEPDVNMVLTKLAAHVLVGPRPEQPVQFTALADREVFITKNDNFVQGQEALRQIHDATLLAATGGRLAALTPAPIVEATR